MKTITIAPNRPITLALADPEGQFDHETGNGLYQTTAGELLTLPRPAVVALNLVEPRPGEEIRILKSWSGKYAEPSQWSIELTARSEQARANAGSTATPLEAVEAGDSTPEPVKPAVAPPVPISRPSRHRLDTPQVQPRLFDTRGTGTHGPAPAMRPDDAPLSIPLPAAAIGKRRIEGQIPANVAMREILAFIKADPSTAGWDAQSIQDLCSTAYIAAVKQGWITVWERGNG